MQSGPLRRHGGEYDRDPAEENEPSLPIYCFDPVLPLVLLHNDVSYIFTFFIRLHHYPVVQCIV